MSHETVYAIASGKGGVGKTTTAVNLGTALAAAGRRVVLVDADLGMANLASFVGLSPDGATLHDVLAGDAPVAEATYRLATNLVAVPSGTALDDYAATSPEGLRDVVATLRDRADVVLLDVGAGVSHETVLPLGLADAAVLVTTPDPAAVSDVRKTVELTERAGGAVAGLLVTRVRPDDPVSPDEIASTLDLDLLGSIPEDDAAAASLRAGTPMVVRDVESPAAVAYRDLTATLAGRDAPSRTGSDDPDGPDEREEDPSDARATDRREATDGGSADVATSDEVSSAITEAEADPS